MAGSLRDQLSEVYEQIVPEGGEVEQRVDTPAPEAAPLEPEPSKIREAKPAASKPAQPELALGDDRPRDPKTGQFVSPEEIKDTKAASPATAKAAPAAKPSAAVVHKTPAGFPKPSAAPVSAPPPAQAPAQALPQAQGVKARPPRPSSWKKEMWDKWETLDPDVAEYLHTRESQYANGVSTYKAELDAHKPVIEAMQQFMPELQQNKVDPSRWISELGNVHRVLAFGNPAQKLQTLANVARAYGVPIQAFSDQNAQQQFLQQGQWQAPYQPPKQPAQQPLTREEAQKLWQEQYLQQTSEQEIQRFAADTEKHQHYEAVRDTMARLLEAGIAEDLESAYDTALRMPQHSDIWDAMQKQQRETEEAERQRQAQERVGRARGKAVSPASATPNVPGSEEKPKGLRSTLSEAFDSHVAGRV